MDRLGSFARRLAEARYRELLNDKDDPVDLLDLHLRFPDQIIPHIEVMWPETAQEREEITIWMWGEAVRVIDLHSVFNVPANASPEVLQTCTQLTKVFEMSFINLIWNYIDTIIRWKEDRYEPSISAYRITDNYYARWQKLLKDPDFPKCQDF